ncbi:hypothetical protein [Thermotalea metallivorans]|uniref:Uncharacterized protein n=1 Tax=Thermotalea metallivorans TaxID=520762 RepID=A0A140L789_9FIRM|nr:hypothetical protein [Thermotalea metallivorans]KXG76414.1 hypothetical protein AN619_09450 [Thermotalea metallivorans]
MLGAVVIATFITMILFIAIENFRRDMTLRHIFIINEKLKDFVSNYLGEIQRFDIFLVKNLREKIKEDFMKEEQIDYLELSMIDSRHLKIAYEVDGTREEVEISTALGKVEITEVKVPEEMEGYE